MSRSQSRRAAEDKDVDKDGAENVWSGGEMVQDVTQGRLLS